MLVTPRQLAPSLCKVLLVAVSLALGGCIADTAEDSDLPWSSSKSWEGMAPIAPSVMDRYE